MQAESQLQDHLIKLKEAAIISDPGPPSAPAFTPKEQVLDATKRKMQYVSEEITQQQRAEFDRIRKSTTVEQEDSRKSFKEEIYQNKDDSHEDTPSISSSVKDAMNILLPGSTRRSVVVPTSPTSNRIIGGTPSGSEDGDSLDLDNILSQNNKTKIRRSTISDSAISIPTWANSSQTEDIASTAKRAIDFLSDSNKKTTITKTTIRQSKKEASIFDED